MTDEYPYVDKPADRGWEVTSPSRSLARHSFSSKEVAKSRVGVTTLSKHRREHRARTKGSPSRRSRRMRRSARASIETSVKGEAQGDGRTFRRVALAPNATGRVLAEFRGRIRSRAAVCAGSRGASERVCVCVRVTSVCATAHSPTHRGRKINTYPPTDRPTDRPTDDAQTRRDVSDIVIVHPPGSGGSLVGADVAGNQGKKRSADRLSKRPGRERERRKEIDRRSRRRTIHVRPVPKSASMTTFRALRHSRCNRTEENAYGAFTPGHKVETRDLRGDEAPTVKAPLLMISRDRLVNLVEDCELGSANSRRTNARFVSRILSRPRSN